MLNEEIKHVAWGPKKSVQSCTQLFVNGYNFHTVNHSKGKSAKNMGGCIKGWNYGDEHVFNYNGVLKEVIELEYSRLPVKKAFLFHGDWYNPREEVGVGTRFIYRIVDVNQKKLWIKYEPFALAQLVIPVYLIPYPTLKGDNSEWLHGCHVATRRNIEISLVHSALQEDEV